MRKQVVTALILLTMLTQVSTTPTLTVRDDHSSTVKNIIEILKENAIYRDGEILGWRYRLNSSYSASEDIFNGYTVGSAGIGEFLIHAAEQGYTESIPLVESLVDHFVSSASSNENGTWWSEYAQERAPPYTGSRYGGAGIIRFLAESSTLTDVNISILRDAARWIFTTEDENGNIPISPNSFYTSGMEYGMTGIATDLLLVFEKTGDDTFLAMAEQIAWKLQAIARHEQGEFGDMASILWTAYGEGTQFEDLVVISVDAGMAGVMRFFDSLYERTGNESYYLFADKLANYILEKDAGGFWFNSSVGYITKGGSTHGLLGYQSGSAGIATSLLLHYEIRSDREELLEAAARVEKLLDLKVEDGGKIPVSIEESVYYSGMRQGSVGYGMYNLDLYELFGEQRYIERAGTIADYVARWVNSKGLFPVSYDSARYGYSFNLEEGIAGAGEFLLRYMNATAGTPNERYGELLESVVPSTGLGESSNSTVQVLPLALFTVLLLSFKRRRLHQR